MSSALGPHDDNGGRNGPRGAQPTGSHAIGEKRRRPWWLWLLLGLVALLALIFGLSRCGADDAPAATASSSDVLPSGSPSVSASVSPSPAESSPADSSSASASASHSASASGSASPAESSDSSSARTAGSGGQLTAGETALLSSSGTATARGDLSQYVGTSARARGARVQSVPADEGFWVGSSEADRVFVRLITTGAESSYTVKEGDRVDFSGAKVVSNPDGFATDLGLSDAEGAGQLTEQKAHIDVPASSLKLSG